MFQKCSMDFKFLLGRKSLFNQSNHRTAGHFLPFFKQISNDILMKGIQPAGNEICQLLDQVIFDGECLVSQGGA